MADITDERIDDTARQVFGYDELRDDQRRAIASVVAGNDTVVVMPTGAGKSAIYQIAGLLVPGPTVVVSPLLALQRDQLQSLAANDVDNAGQASSAVTDAERRRLLEEVEEGGIEFLFLAPEQFADREAHARVTSARPSLFVVDEAHCISTWGHDFRPDYLRLGGVIEAVGHPRVLAMTATAAPPARDEIVRQLGMREPNVIVSGFDRPNLRLEVRTFHDPGDKRAALVDFVSEAPRPGIVYAATRRATEEIAGALEERGLRAGAYHAGLRNGDRRETQDAFMDGTIDVIVATVAFGMGIDKPDVRFVVHHDVPASLDAYYQEIGRAGRDGEPADAVLFFRSEDVGRSRFRAGRSALSAEQLRTVAGALAAAGEMSVEEITDGTGISRGRVRTALGLLEQAGVVHTRPGDRAVVAAPGDEHMAVAVDAVAEREAATEAVDRSRVEMMRAYAEARDCRRRLLLNYFGERYERACGACDVCASGAALDPVPAAEQLFLVHSRVEHANWGTGTVVRYEGEEKVVVLFDEAGYKTLAVELVRDGDLLGSADPA